MADTGHIGPWQLPEFPQFDDDVKLRSDAGSALKTAGSGYGHLKKIQSEHRAELERISENLEVGREAKARLRNRAAIAAGTKLAEWGEHYLKRTRGAADAMRTGWLAGGSVVGDVEPLDRQQARGWLLGLSQADRQQAITQAMQLGDRVVLAAALSAPPTFNFLDAGKREAIARQLDPKMAAQVDALAEAVQALDVGRRVIEGETAKARDPEAARQDELAEQERRLLAQRQADA